MAPAATKTPSMSGTEEDYSEADPPAQFNAGIMTSAIQISDFSLDDGGGGGDDGQNDEEFETQSISTPTRRSPGAGPKLHFQEWNFIRNPYFL